MGTRNMEGGNKDINKNCFEKYGVVKSNEDLIEVKKVRELSLNMSSTEYVYFDVDIPTSNRMINEHKVDWPESLREYCINAITTQSNVSEETHEISDDDDIEEEDDIQEE